MRRLWFVCVFFACRFVAQEGPPADGARIDAHGSDATVADAPPIDAPPIDAPPIDAGPTVGPCGSPGTIRDDFEDGSAASFWIVFTNGGTVSESTGQLVITPIAGGAPAGYLTKHTVDLTSSAVQVDVDQVPDPASAVVTELVLPTDGARSIGMSVLKGMLTVQVTDPTNALTKTVAYDPVQQRTWRIEEAGGTLTFRTSPDGHTWTDVTSGPTPSGASHARIVLATDKGAANAGSAVFDNLDLGETASACAVDSLHDTFPGPKLDDAWAANPGSAGCAFSVNNGVHVDENGKADVCFATSMAAYALTASSITVDTSAIPTGAGVASGWAAFLGVEDDSGNHLQLTSIGAMICAQASGGPTTCRAQAPAEVFWRIREAAGTVTLETSVDNTTYVPVAALADPFALSSVGVVFGSQATVDESPHHVPFVFKKLN